MTSSKRKSPMFRVGQVVSIKRIKGVCGWGQITGMTRGRIQLDEIGYVTYKPSELRPLSKEECNQ